MYEKFTSAKFRQQLADITGKGDPVIVKSHDRIMGVYVPMSGNDIEALRERLESTMDLVEAKAAFESAIEVASSVDS